MINMLKRTFLTIVILIVIITNISCSEKSIDKEINDQKIIESFKNIIEKSNNLIEKSNTNDGMEEVKVKELETLYENTDKKINIIKKRNKKSKLKDKVIELAKLSENVSKNIREVFNLQEKNKKEKEKLANDEKIFIESSNKKEINKKVPNDIEFNQYLKSSNFEELNKSLITKAEKIEKSNIIDSKLFDEYNNEWNTIIDVTKKGKYSTKEGENFWNTYTEMYTNLNEYLKQHTISISIINDYNKLIETLNDNIKNLVNKYNEFSTIK